MASIPDILEVPRYILVNLARQLSNFFTCHEQGRSLKGCNRVSHRCCWFLPSTQCIQDKDVKLFTDLQRVLIDHCLEDENFSPFYPGTTLFCFKK